jgi:hypothetical protein
LHDSQFLQLPAILLLREERHSHATLPLAGSAAGAGWRLVMQDSQHVMLAAAGNNCTRQVQYGVHCASQLRCRRHLAAAAEDVHVARLTPHCHELLALAVSALKHHSAGLRRCPVQRVTPDDRHAGRLRICC